MMDALLPNLLLFATGQAAAWYYLRTGRWWVGVAASAALWVLADWLFLAKYAFAATGTDLMVPLVALQAVAAGIVLVLAWALWRRRWSATARQRPQIFGDGVAAYLRGDHAAARQTLRRLVRTDPWDTAAWVALGNVELRDGNPARAKRCYRRAVGVDTKALYGDLIAHQLQSMQTSSAPRGEGASGG